MVNELKEIITNMQSFLGEYGFKPVEDELGRFANDKKDFVIRYDNAKKLFTLNIADVTDNEIGEYKTASTWLFDDTHRADDTATIAKDFEDVLFKSLGLVRKKVNGVEEVQLPTKTLAGQTPGIEGFTQKFLTIFPQYKDAYKENVAEYGEFLYVEFFKNYGVEKLEELIADPQKNKKQLSKYFDMLGKMFEDGDSTVASVITTVIMAGTFLDKPQEFENFKDQLAEHKELFNASKHSIQIASKNKKLRLALGK